MIINQFFSLSLSIANPIFSSPKWQILVFDGLPKEKYAVIVFSGLVRESSYLEKEKLLNQFIKEKKLKTSGEIKIARYNPPWTLPFFRRNELMIKIN